MSLICVVPPHEGLTASEAVLALLNTKKSSLMKSGIADEQTSLEGACDQVMIDNSIAQNSVEKNFIGLRSTTKIENLNPND